MFKNSIPKQAFELRSNWPILYEELMENSSKAEQYWNRILEQGMGDLSRAAQEISNGGLSSYSKRRIKKQKAESAKSKQVGGEEE